MPGDVRGSHKSKSDARRDPSRSSQRDIHEITWRLHSAVEGKLRPRQAFQKTVDDLANPAHRASSSGSPTPNTCSRRTPAVAVDDEPDPVATPAGSEVLDWIENIGGTSAESFAHALERWDATRSDAWLVAAMMQVPPDHSDVPRVLEAASAVSVTSPAFATVAFHRARVLLRTGRVDDARGARRRPDVARAATGCCEPLQGGETDDGANDRRVRRRRPTPGCAVRRSRVQVALRPRGGRSRRARSRRERPRQRADATGHAATVGRTSATATKHQKRGAARALTRAFLSTTW